MSSTVKKIYSLLLLSVVSDYKDEKNQCVAMRCIQMMHPLTFKLYMELLRYNRGRLNDKNYLRIHKLLIRYESNFHPPLKFLAGRTLKEADGDLSLLPSEFTNY